MITFKDRSTNPVDEYRIATIMETRVNTSNLSRNEFISLMHENLTRANAEYREIAVPEAIERHKQSNDWNIKWTIKHATEFAERKWKTEKKRTAHVEAEVAKTKAHIEFNDKLFEDQLKRLYNLFFDFNPKPDQGIPGVCVLHYDADDDFLGRCYDELTKYDWWGKAKGWVMKYTCTKTSVHADFRPWIEYIFDDETRAEWEAQQKGIDDAITAYYASKKSGEYVGD